MALGLPQLVLHQVLVEVDAEQRADDLAGRHPPRQEGEETSEEKWSEDGAQRHEGLCQVGNCGLDVLIHVVHPLFIFIETTGQHGRCYGQYERWRHPGGLICIGLPREVPYKTSRDQSIPTLDVFNI